MIRANLPVSSSLHLFLWIIPIGREGGHGDHGAAAAGVAPAAGNGMTELQKHVAFFDRNHDGIITFDETYQGEPGV